MPTCILQKRKRRLKSEDAITNGSSIKTNSTLSFASAIWPTIRIAQNGSLISADSAPPKVRYARRATCSILPTICARTKRRPSKTSRRYPCSARRSNRSLARSQNSVANSAFQWGSIPRHNWRISKRSSSARILNVPKRASSSKRRISSSVRSRASFRTRAMPPLSMRRSSARRSWMHA